MEKIKRIYLVILIAHLAHEAHPQMAFPDDSDGPSIMKYSSNWQTSGSSHPMVSGTKTVKTSYSSSSRSSSSSDSEPTMVRFSSYQTGSGAQTNAGSSSFGGGGYPSQFGSGMSGSSSSAYSSSNSFGSPGQLSYGGGGSGSMASAGGMSGSGQGGQTGSSGSSASASSSSMSMGGAQCSSRPAPPANVRLSCSGNSCQATCLPDYKFMNGATSLMINCMGGRWVVKDLNLNEIPPCDPVCLPACQNKGICIAPGQCKCPQNFMGPTCQMEKKLCLASPQLPAHSKRSCSQSTCSLTCMKGYKFPDSTLTMNLNCVNGEWVPDRQGLKEVPDCQPTCDPACQNGGTCISFNVCQCPREFRGKLCQWSIDRCATTKLGFNGGFQCSGTADALNCKLTCPKTVNFEYTPAEIYSCSYATGEFVPEQTPKCVFPKGMSVVTSKPVTSWNQTSGSMIKTGGSRRVIEVPDEGEDEEIEETETIITKKTIRKKVKSKQVYTIDEDEQFFEAPGVYSMYMIQDLEVSYKTPKPSVCMTWNGNKIKTFDGLSYSHELVCAHTLIQDIVDGTFSVIVRACPYDADPKCPFSLEIFAQNEQFTFEKIDGIIKMFTTKREIPIPVQMSGVKVTRSGTDVRIVLEQVPVVITWDSKKFVQVDVTETLWNRTAGLCGTMDGIMSNDFTSKDGSTHKLASTFVDSWKASTLDKDKSKCVARSQQLTSLACDTATEEKANMVCTDLLKNPKMKTCLKLFNADILMKNCISDYCDCKNTYERTECICSGIGVLAKDCRFRGIPLEDGWRDWQICPLNCTNGRVYKSCGPLNEPSCGSAIEQDALNCREGCFCPEGFVLNDGVCVEQQHCPCKLKGKVFQPKSQIKKDCNTCVCEKGNWQCTSLTCGARCAAVGDPHYSTFDGKRFDFMGKCTYYLMKTADMSVEAENVACSGTISENMNFLPSVTTDMPSCTKSLTIRFRDDAGRDVVIKLKQGGFVLIDGYELMKLPKDLSNGMVRIRQVSSSFLIVEFRDGVTVWWDGATRAYIDAPASYRGKTKGLCGTFNANMQDDFLTPEGDTETAVHLFANKWRTRETCDDVSDKLIQHPCQVNVENKAKAAKICEVLRKEVFEDCHLFVDFDEFYENCLYDVCACKGDTSQCFCPIFASYAAECARQGTTLEWRHKVQECAVKCPIGQVFQQCGEACSRTCSDLQDETPCKLQCVEGCRCPMGQVLDENNECVTIEMCKCVYKGMEFKPNYKEVRPGRKTLELCTCSGARWKCVEAKTGDETKYPPASEISKKCLATKNEIFTTCEPAEPVTCKNMHLNITSSTAMCQPGCKCKPGFVLDLTVKQCVLPEHCSCHHGGRSYSEGEHIKEECNTCMCKGGKWQCTTKACASTCSAWGDSHFTTFDGREFDFQGVCSYVLSKGQLPNGDCFKVSIQNVLCGSNGVTCSKSLEISLGGSEPESLTFSADLPVPGVKNNGNPIKRMIFYRSGNFMFVEVISLGVLLKWDRGTRVYLKLDNRWKGKVQGLCGNYNYDSLDDFTNPSLGVESSPTIFGHSWKLDDSCAIPVEQVDSCALSPHRKTWAVKKCGVLKSAEFKLCHSEVPVDNFYKRCVFDSCSCDQGGDCECLCTALSAYADACALKGIFIKWRTPDLCPMQCDPTCSNYSPCVTPCPPDTCDNFMNSLKSQRLCNLETCVEGCKLKGCPEGSVYVNSSYSECVPSTVCNPVCLIENGVTYFEGDLMASDSCHTCKCSRGKKICTGVPCSIDVPDSREDNLKCVSGWSAWINQDMLDQATLKSSKSNYFKIDDIEPLPTNMQMKNLLGPTKAVCSSSFFGAVECRTVIGHKTPKSTGQDVECSTERGLLCKGQCFDYEIRVYCECNEITNVAYSPPPTRPPLTTPRPVIVPVTPAAKIVGVCDPNIPNIEHPYSCTKFLQCAMSPNGTFIYAEKTCGDSMMFNPKAMVCDWPASVQAIKPACGGKPEKPEKLRECLQGFTWSECSIPCNRACHYYNQILRGSSKCPAGSGDCLPGCVPIDAPLKCDYPKLWRDQKSCVDLQACTCMGPNGEILKPGQVIEVNECKTCQCLNNEYICANVPCSKQPSTLPPLLIVSSTVKPIESIPIPPPEDFERTINIPSYITICDPSIPHVAHPNSCYKFLHCQPLANGSYQYAVKTCYPDMMFNPTNMICDWPASVKAIKPACGTNPGEIEIWETVEIEESRRVVVKKPRTTVKPASGGSGGWSIVETTYEESEYPEYMIKCPSAAAPLKAHPESCYKYLECMRDRNGVFRYQEKTCGPDMMYSPASKDCSWPDTVIAQNPMCSPQPTTTELPSFNLVTGRPSTQLPAITLPRTTPRPFVPTDAPIILPSTMTPPNQCEQSQLITMMNLLPDSAISASSILGNTFKPEFARIESKPVGQTSSGSWSPKTNDLNQFLQIEFNQPIPMYGVIIRGSPMFDQYVTSFKVLYSYDGSVYHVFADKNGRPQIFSGSVDAKTPVNTLFHTPVEAKIVRIYPISWKGSIALRAELLGCQSKMPPMLPVTTQPPPMTTTQKASKHRKLIVSTTFIVQTTQAPVHIEQYVEPLCDDPLGVENQQMYTSQITFSSNKESGAVKTKPRKTLETIKLSSIRGWMPLTDNTNEFIQFDFLEPRNITGFVTKGGDYGWVKSFTVSYSKDNIIWNKVIDETQRPKEFLANVDSENVKKNLFKYAVNAQFVRIQPSKWHGVIELKVEPLGCFLPYRRELTKEPATTTTSKPDVDFEIITPGSCGICKGALVSRPLDPDSCTCYPPLFWSGSECVPQSQCPCYEGHIAYEIGENYQTEDCSECICKIGGVPDCRPKVCPPCGSGLRRENPKSCSCTCIKCPPDTILCPTSGQCIPEEDWCNGVQDCPDDEKGCVITEKPYIHETVVENRTITKVCPDPKCPPGTQVKQRRSKMMSRFSDSGEEDEDNDKPQHQYYYIKAKYSMSYEAILPISTNSKQQDINSEECLEFMCIPIVAEPDEPDFAGGDQRVVTRCPETKCPRGYTIRLQTEKTAAGCDKFSCQPIVDNDVVCNVTGRTFDTFDTTEFKYDICNHLLARDIEDTKWNVIIRKNCSSGNNACSKEVEIRDKVSKYTLILFTSLSINLDGYHFTVQQLQNSNKKMTFTVSKNGDNLLYVSHAHGIWLTYDQYGDIKFGISSQYKNKVDGLCGFYEGVKENDKRKPSGDLASSTHDFGDSWSIGGLNKEDCEPHVCPIAVQNTAMTMCNLAKDDLFKSCHPTISPDRFASTCLETACDCLLASSNGSAITKKDTDACKCSMLKNYVVDCLAADETVHLETWRSVYSCEASCPAPFVHHDCFRRKCETTCKNLQSSECNTVPGTCFSGCYCPSGTVRKDSTCIPISECRDCVCDGFGKSQYITYDRKNFTFNGNCTYLLSRDIKVQNVHTFQVYATVGACDVKKGAKATCTQAFHVVYGNHIIHVQKSPTNELTYIVDGLRLKSLPYNQNGIKISEQGKAFTVLLTDSQVELSSLFDAMMFTIKLPSVKYGNKMEGLCGNCNGNPDDDMITNPAVRPKPGKSELQNFVLGWMADDPKLTLNENKDTCVVDEEENCLPLPPETDPCMKIYDEDIFGKCHFVVDPMMYITACQQDLCKTGPVQKGACESLAAYARECARNGVCVDWRNGTVCSLDCFAPFAYNPCGCSETCKTVEEKDKMIKASTAVKSSSNIAKLKSICSTALSEGCFCPAGLVLHNGKCLREAECRACDDKGHLPGDVWHPDVCTSCTCTNDSKIQCQKTQCPAQNAVCGLGFIAIEVSSVGECCKKFNCVPEDKPVKGLVCQKPVLPKCGLNQMNKMISSPDGCSKYVCDCIPKDQCKPLDKLTPTQIGFKSAVDATGCCPVAKLVCDKSLCPNRPSQCAEAFYTVKTLKTAAETNCCDEYACVPPPNECIATTHGGKKILKKIDETWETQDLCLKVSCVFDTNGNPIIKTQRQTCTEICQPGFELKPVPNKCCGVCVKTKCVVDNKIYDVGASWKSSDNCTTFSCNIDNGETYMASMMPTCPDVSKCATSMIYTDGCCKKCKVEPLSQQNCLPESLAESVTVGLVKTQVPPHGNCKNHNAIRGITQCAGNCKSGTRFDSLTLLQLKQCDCCSPSGFREIQVELICDDKFKLIKHVNVPAACSCSKCSDEDSKLSKLTAAS